MLAFPGAHGDAAQNQPGRGGRPVRGGFGPTPAQRPSRTVNAATARFLPDPFTAEALMGETTWDVELDSPADADQQPPRFVLHVDHHVEGSGHYSRLMSVSGAMSVHELVEAILTCYDWPEPLDSWSFRAKKGGVMKVFSRRDHSIGTEVATALGAAGIAVLKAQEFTFFISVADVVRELPTGTDSEGHDHAGEFAATGDVAARADAEASGPGAFPRALFPDATTRDDTPDAVLLNAAFMPDDIVTDRGIVAGSHAGRHPLHIPATVDLSSTNIALAGEDSVEQLIALVNPGLQELLRTGQLADFVPLLQALDLDRPADVGEHAAELLADAPVESSAIGRAAAWSRIVAQSTLADEVGVDQTATAFMAALGFTRGDAIGTRQLGKLKKTERASDPLTGEEIKRLSKETGQLLALAGAEGWQVTDTQDQEAATLLTPRSSLVERLEMYRFLLQR